MQLWNSARDKLQKESGFVKIYLIITLPEKTTYLFFEQLDSQASLILFPFYFSKRKNDRLKRGDWRKKKKMRKRSEKIYY